MKKIALFCLVMAMVVAAGCGADGKDGDAFLALNWVYTPLYYSDNNPSLPSTIYPGQNYKTAPGTYSFYYVAWDNSGWTGNYTITVNTGEEGGLFFWDDGTDGADKYFELWLYSFGPSFYEYKIVNASASADILSRATLTTPQAFTGESEVYYQQKVQGRYTATLIYQRK